MTWNWDLRLLEKFIESSQRATIYKIWNHQKACTRETEREWKLIYLNLHITTNSRICRWSLTYLIISKKYGKACEIWLKLRLHKGMETFQTLQTWIGNNATHYHDLNGLLHAIPYIYFLWDLPDFGLFATRYYHFFKKNINIYFL